MTNEPFLVEELLIVLGGSADPERFGSAFYLYRRIYSDGSSKNVVFDCGAELYDDVENDATGKEVKVKRVRGGNFDYLKENNITVHAVVISHGHLDHVGMVAKLKRYLAPGALIWASPQTHDIFHDLCWETLKFSPGTFTYFEVLDVTSKRRRAILVPGENEILPGLIIFAGPNGHVPGSAFFIVGNALLLNDFCIHDQPVVTGARPFSQCVPEEWRRKVKKVPVTDLTYGNASRKNWVEQLILFEAWIDGIHARGGKAIVPAFRFGREQNLALELARDGFEVVVDGGGRSTFLSFLRHRWSPNDQNDFSFKNISFVYSKRVMHELEDEAAAAEACGKIGLAGELRQLSLRLITRDELASSTRPVVILTTAGMGDGGPFGYYAQRSLGNPKDGIARVGFCSPGTTMDRIIKAKKSGERVIIPVDDEIDDLGNAVNFAEFSVECDVGEFSFSAHGDLEDSAAYLADLVAANGMKFELIGLAHGSRESKENGRRRFADLVESKTGLVDCEPNTVIRLYCLQKNEASSRGRHFYF